MYFDNRNRPQTSVYGCSSTGLIIGAVILLLMVFGGFFLVLRYSGLIIALGVIVWLFRKFLNKDKVDSSQAHTNGPEPKNWSRNFEKEKNSPFDNEERDFEEIDEDEMDDF